MLNKIVLIADDSILHRKILSSKLTHLGIDHIITDCGHKAFAELEKSITGAKKVTIAILDENMIMMGGCMDGSQVVKLWKEKHPNEKITFFSFSGDDMSNRGFDSIFGKDKASELVKAVEMIYFS